MKPMLGIRLNRRHVAGVRIVAFLSALWLCGALQAAIGQALDGRVVTNTLPSIVYSDQVAHALAAGDVSGLRAAFERGADVNSASTNGLPPILELLKDRTVPLSKDQIQCLALLIERGADLAVTDSDRRTPLIHAARAGDIEAVRMITEAGVYVRSRDRFWKTALLNAAAAGHRDVVLYLASNGDIQSPSIRERRERGRR